MTVSFTDFRWGYASRWALKERVQVEVSTEVERPCPMRTRVGVCHRFPTAGFEGVSTAGVGKEALLRGLAGLLGFGCN